MVESGVQISCFFAAGFAQKGFILFKTGDFPLLAAGRSNAYKSTSFDGNTRYLQANFINFAV
jgi:hypothetical protein